MKTPASDKPHTQTSFFQHLIRRCGIMLLLCAGAGVAQLDQDRVQQLKIGLAAVTSESVYLGGDNQSRAFPAIDYRLGRFYFQAGDLGFDLLTEDKWEIDAGLSINLAGDIDRGDSPLLSHLPDLHYPLHAFISTQYKASFGLITLKHEHEINNKHDGHSSSLSYAAPIRKGQWLFLPRLSFQRHSAETVNYFYGVLPTDATDQIPAYESDAVNNWQLSVLGLYQINDKWSLVGNVQNEFYGDGISNSPIVDDNSRLSIFAGFLYEVF